MSTTAISSYEQARDEHRWQVPERYNIAADICDRHPRDKLAMIHEDFAGNVRRVNWGEIQDNAARFAGVLRAHGVEPGDRVVDCTGATVMPGLVESHSHLTFPSAVGHIDPTFNPPLDVSFFHHMPTPDQHLAIARRNAKILLDHGFTSAYSAGSLTPVPIEVQLRDGMTRRGITGEAAEQIITPLGMAHTFLFAGDAITYNVAVGHEGLARGAVVSRPYTVRRRMTLAAGAVAGRRTARPMSRR